LSRQLWSHLWLLDYISFFGHSCQIQIVSNFSTWVALGLGFQILDIIIASFLNFWHTMTKILSKSKGLFAFIFMIPYSCSSSLYLAIWIQNLFHALNVKQYCLSHRHVIHHIYMNMISMMGCMHEVHIVLSSLLKFRKNIHTRILMPTWNMYRNLTNLSKVNSTSAVWRFKSTTTLDFYLWI
jgi:hypothetical protein